jgi:hypothetical protein
MAAWQGTQPSSFGGVDVWRHQVTLYLRARETFDGDPPTAYYRLFRLITKGVPVSAGVPMLNATVHPACHPMDLPLIQRQTDAEGSTILRRRSALWRWEMTEQVVLISSDGEVRYVEARPEILVPLMVRGYRQLTEHEDEEVTPDVRRADAGNPDLLR